MLLDIRLIYRNGIESVGAGAFHGRWFESVVFPSTISRIERESFKNGHIKNLEINATDYLSLGSYSFQNNYLKSVQLQAKVIVLYDYCLTDNRNLESITINADRLDASRNSLRNLPQNCVIRVSNEKIKEEIVNDFPELESQIEMISE